MSPAFRSADSIGPEHVGARVTIRRRNADGSLSDVIGVLDSIDADAVTVTDRRGTTHTIPIELIVAARVIR